MFKDRFDWKPLISHASQIIRFHQDPFPTRRAWSTCTRCGFKRWHTLSNMANIWYHKDCSEHHFPEIARLVQNMLSPPREIYGLKMDSFSRCTYSSDKIDIHQWSIIIIAFFIPLHDHVWNTVVMGRHWSPRAQWTKSLDPELLSQNVPKSIVQLPCPAMRLLRPCFSRFNSVNSSRCKIRCKA